MHDLYIENLTFLDRGPYNLTVEGGECCGIRGKSGSGKTLLLRAIADLDPRTGKMALGGTDCDRTEAPQWRKMVGMLPAESGWWYDSIGEHFVALDDKIIQAAKRLGFDRDVFRWEVRRLSTGEKQRLALLRLLVNEPEALLLDEPTASLDAENTDRVEKMLTGYYRRKNIPVIWVSHDLEQLGRVAGRILLMQPDGLTAEG